MRVELEEAVEVVTAGDGQGRALISCEHASERLPEPWEWPDADRWLVGTHWAYDIGASDLARELCGALGSVAVLARFSRLLVDPNRPLDSDTLFREVADGHPVAINQKLAAVERQLRIDRYHEGFHGAVDRELANHPAEVVLSIHTFTPLYEGEVRQVEVAVLFDSEEQLAAELRDLLLATGLKVGMNEPYSGKAGMMYSADRHAQCHGRRAVELEIRQDLAVEAKVRRQLIEALGARFGRSR